MQPVEAQTGVSTKSHLYNSLKVYLNNRNRLQPIIGLGSIIECVKAGTHSVEALYLCEVCGSRLGKADIRNHIMGSLHRYNYIKAWHPDLLSEWKENFDLSKLAWPLMEKAKILEGKEGPGDVQLIEVDDAIYQRMLSTSETDAVTLMKMLRGELDSHSETTSMQLEHSPIQSHRIVFFAQNQEGWSKKSLRTSAETNTPLSLIHSTGAPSVKSVGRLNNTSTSLPDNTQTSHEKSVLSKNSKSFLDGYRGTKPLIGLFCVVECKSEDGHTYCFLCHCCRARTNKKGIIDHLTSSSHLVNYLMETRPEQVEVMMADIIDNQQLLQSLAQNVEQEEGRGKLKVVTAPESLCILLTSKSYDWCMKWLCKGWTNADFQKEKRKIAVRGPSVNKTSNQDFPDKSAVVMRKTRKINNTVFKVSLPLTKGSVLLERTSFSKDSLPVSSTYSTPSDSDLIPMPESQSEDCELDCDNQSFAISAELTSMCTTSQLQQHPYSGGAEAGQYMGPERNFASHYQEVDGYFSNNEYVRQSEYITGTEDSKVYGGKNYNRQHSSQGRSNKRFYKKVWQNEDPQTSVVPLTQDWSSYRSLAGRVEGCSEQRNNSTLQSKTGIRVEVLREERWEMSSNATQYYYQQQPQYQYMTQDHASLLTSVGQHGSSGELAPHLDAATVDRDYSFFQTEVRPWKSSMEFTIGHAQTAPQSYTSYDPANHPSMPWGDV